MILSSDFHENKQSGEIHQAVSIGSTLTNILRFGIFYWVATWTDAFVAVAYLYSIFGVYMGFIISFMVATYFTAKMGLNPMQDGKVKDLIVKCRAESSVRLEAIINWSTVFVSPARIRPTLITTPP
jgi:ABC-type transport system involved in Fe-S cluster assembly fused permease/ATPase subunit